MYIDKYNIKILGQEYDSKKDKYVNDLTKLTLNSTDGLHHKKFITMLEELYDAHEGQELELDIKIKQHQYNN